MNEPICRHILWATQLRSCLLCMTSLNKANISRIYCGLSDGNLAIVQVNDRLIQIFSTRDPSSSYVIVVNPKKHFVLPSTNLLSLQ